MIVYSINDRTVYGSEQCKSENKIKDKNNKGLLKKSNLVISENEYLVTTDRLLQNFDLLM